jgi:hypothetical protein
MINLLKEKDIERGLTLLEYIDWCKLYDKRKIVNIESSKDINKKDILEYSSKLNKAHKIAMNNKSYTDANPKMFKCWYCDYAKDFSKAHSILSGKIEYTVTCLKEKVCFGVAWDAHVSALPCWKNEIDF